MITREATSKKALGQTKIEILEDSQLESKKDGSCSYRLFVYLPLQSFSKYFSIYITIIATSKGKNKFPKRYWNISIKITSFVRRQLYYIISDYKKVKVNLNLYPAMFGFAKHC